MANTLRLPHTIPIQLGIPNYKVGIKLPHTLPVKFQRYSTENISYTKKLPIYLRPAEAQPNQVSLKISVKPAGWPTYLPITETVWVFNGLLVSENLVTNKRSSLLIDERIYSQIIPSFKLVSPTELEVSWSGTRVPRVEIYTKSLETEEYTLFNSYSWNRGSATIPLEDHNYYIRLVGARDSGQSEEYLINSALQIGIQPELEMVSDADKIYNVDVDYISEYQIQVEY